MQYKINRKINECELITSTTSETKHYLKHGNNISLPITGMRKAELEIMPAIRFIDECKRELLILKK